MADQAEDIEVTERDWVRAHYRDELARVAAIPAEAREADLRIVRKVATVRRRTAV